MIETMEILSHPLYLAPVPLYAHLFESDGFIVDGHSPFVKQTYRNRTTIATECGEQSLTIPIIHDAGTVAMQDIRISEHGNWRHRHWNALVSAYRKSPFFDYYADDFAYEKDGADFAAAGGFTFKGESDDDDLVLDAGMDDGADEGMYADDEY